MRVQDIMARSPKSCAPATNLAEAAEMMWLNDCGSLPVTGEGNKVIGMITDRDICIALGTRNGAASQWTVGEVTNGKVYVCAPGDDIGATLETMRKQQLRRLPVVNKAGVLQGILCLNEIVLHAQKRNGLSYEDVIDTLKAISEHRMAPQAAVA